MSYLLVNLLSGCALQTPSNILVGDIRIAADYDGESEKPPQLAALIEALEVRSRSAHIASITTCAMGT